MRHQLAVKQIIGRQSVDLKGSLDPQVRRDRAVQLDPKDQLVLECRVQQAKLDQLAQLGSKVPLDHQVLANRGQVERPDLPDQQAKRGQQAKLEPRAKSVLRARLGRQARQVPLEVKASVS